MANKKYAAKGPRKYVDWGTVKRKVNGKSTSVKVYSRVISSVSTALGITVIEPAKLPGATVKTKKNKAQYLGGPSITKSGSKYLLCSTGETRKNKSGTYTVFHRVPVPPEISAAKAVAVLKKSKVKLIKFPNGTEYAIGTGK
ncbi:MAG: hypothetical protein KME45_11540 [Stenomitos rutilans HA7619-LM2]|jgi:hypothetical protein|nr:hypothetical protein [Stenomitos rutilans HA7619-LM2]